MKRSTAKHMVNRIEPEKHIQFFPFLCQYLTYEPHVSQGQEHGDGVAEDVGDGHVGPEEGHGEDKEG